MFKLRIDPSDRAEFIKVGRHNLTTSLKNEPGTLTMYATHADPAGTANYVFEVYQDDPSYAIHASSPQFKVFAETAQRVVKKRTVVQLKPDLLVEHPDCFTITGRQAVVRLSQAQLTKQQLGSLLPQLRQAVKNDPHFYACLVGSEPTNPGQTIILTTYRDQAAAERHRALFPRTALVLHPDTIVSHGGLDYLNGTIW